MESKKPAKTLEELRRALNPKPLRPDQLDALFVETDDARDPQRSRREQIAEALAEGSTVKILLAGHRGTGKSTELVKFRSEHHDRFTFVQLSITTDGNPATVGVEALLVLITEAVLRQMAERGIQLKEENLQRIYAWFEETFKIREENLAFDGGISGGLVMKDSLWAKLLGLTATLTAGMRVGSTVVSKTIRKDEARLPDLAARCGELLREAALAVFEKDATHLVLIIEDLDKISVERANKLFIDNPAPLAGLPVRAIFTAPIFLFCNPRSTILESDFEKITLPMIKVEDQEGQRYEPGREAIWEILAHRIDLDACIDSEAVDLAISKTGGVLRHLFETLRSAAGVAGQDYRRKRRQEERICRADVRYGLDQLKNKLWQSIGVIVLPEEFKGIETSHLYERLEQMKVPQRAKSDRVNLLLMQAQALLEYNGTQWHRVHPLVTEALEEQI